MFKLKYSNTQTPKYFSRLSIYLPQEQSLLTPTYSLSMAAKIFALTCALCLPLLLVAQDKTLIDSLYRAFHATSKVADKVDLLYHIANEQDDTGNPDDGFRYADSIEMLSNSIRYPKGLSRAYNLRGYAHYNKGEYTKALECFRQGLDIVIKLKDLEGQAHAYNSIGSAWNELQSPDSAVVYHLKTLAIKEQLGNRGDVAGVLANIANCYNDLEAHDKAIEMHLRALSIRRALGEEKRTMFTLNNLMVAYGTKGDVAKATAYADSALAVALKYNNKMVAGVVCGGMGHVLNDQKRYSESITWCERSLAYLSEAKREPSMVFPLCNMAAAYIGLNLFTKGLEVNQKGWAIMQKLKLQNPLDSYHENFANAYAGLQDYENAYKWHKIYFTRIDTLNKKGYLSKIANIEAKYNLVKKEQEITAQRTANYRQKVALYALSAAFLALLLFGYLFYNRYRLRKKAELDAAVIREQKLGLSAVIEAQEAERRRIAKDLHDGIAQELVALKLGLDVLGHRLGATLSSQETTRLGNLKAQAETACAEVRGIAHSMSPPLLEQQGLAPSLEALLHNTLHPLGIGTHFEQRDLPENLDAKVKIGLYRIAQELVNNIVKHAEAKQVSLRLYGQGSNLVMALQDDGQGYDFERAKTKGSMGLLNIISRVSTLNGTFGVERIAPHGSLATVWVNC